jgi:hypothetical protein
MDMPEPSPRPSAPPTVLSPSGRLPKFAALLALAASAVGCAGPLPALPSPLSDLAPSALDASVASARDAAPDDATSHAALPPDAAAASAGAGAGAVAAAPPAPSFPPASFKPPHERSARAGDGVWQAAPEAGPLGEGVLARATVRPHPFNPFVTVSLVAVDLRRVSLELVAGTFEPASKTVPAERRTGLVPPADHPSLLAVFNGAFQAKHGHHGMTIGADAFLPPLPNACTVALMRDGSVRIGTWSALEKRAPEMRAYRQTPPCMIEGGAPNPLLGGDGARKWGMAADGKMVIRRSALGLDRTGTLLVYGFGEDVTPRLLADAMQAAGAVDVAELDINWSYTRFFFYARASSAEPPHVAASLVPKIKHGRAAYVAEASPRDFFYLKRTPDTALDHAGAR